MKSTVTKSEDFFSQEQVSSSDGLWTDSEYDFYYEIKAAFKNESLDEEKVQEFAFDLVQEIPYIEMSADDLKGLRNKLNELAKQAVAACKALREFEHGRRKIRGSVKSLIISKTVQSEIPAMQVAEYLNSYAEKIAKKGKSLPRANPKYSALDAAQYIAKIYRKHFGCKPYSNQFGHAGERTEKKTDFDRVCAAANKYALDRHNQISSHVCRRLREEDLIAARTKRKK
jgi:hypothetical protein